MAEEINFETAIETAVEATVSLLVNDDVINHVATEIALHELRQHGITEIPEDETSLAYEHYYSVFNEVVQHIISRSAAKLRYFPKTV